MKEGLCIKDSNLHSYIARKWNDLIGRIKKGSYLTNQIFPGHAVFFRSRVIIRATTYQNFRKIYRAVFE